MIDSAGRLRGPDGHEIAFERLPAAPGQPDVVFLHGLASDRRGTKAEALAAHCRLRGYGFLRYDMYGHGESTGQFEEGGPTRWRADALRVFDELTTGPQIVIGSSMGGWVMLMLALARTARIRALLGIAVAPDFTEELLWPRLTVAQQKQVIQEGYIDLPGDYGTPMRFSKLLFDEGRANLVLREPMPLTCPVRLIHGQQDASVPWKHSLRVAEKIAGGDVCVTFVKDGDHRLSRPRDIAMLCRELDLLAGAR